MPLVGSVRGIVNIQLTRQDAADLLEALNYVPPACWPVSVAELEGQLIEILEPRAA